MAELPHDGHDQHLCYLVEEGLLRSKPEEFTPLVKKGKFYCTGCGRVAKKAENLCAPEKL